MEQCFQLHVGDMKVPCLLCEPLDGKPRRIVLGVHGFCGSMHDEIQESIAEEMELFGSAVLRFDLPGHGENEEDVLSLQGCCFSSKPRVAARPRALARPRAASCSPVLRKLR